MKRVYTCLNAILIAAIVIGDCCYIHFGGLALKGTVSFGFFLLGVVNLSYAARKGSRLSFPMAMTLGLFFSMVGDIVLGIDFIVGALFFALGHLMYFVGYSCLEKLQKTDFIPFAVIFATSAALILFLPAFDFGSALMKAVCLIYALIISLMVGKALANLKRQKNTVTVILAVGSVLFYFSDLMLVFRCFAGGPYLTDLLCIAAYYPAQALLAHGIFRAADKK